MSRENSRGEPKTGSTNSCQSYRFSRLTFLNDIYILLPFLFFPNSSFIFFSSFHLCFYYTAFFPLELFFLFQILSTVQTCFLTDIYDESSVCCLFRRRSFIIKGSQMTTKCSEVNGAISQMQSLRFIEWTWTYPIGIIFF